jgi:hypothetical protein
VDVGDDSTSFRARIKPKGQQVLLFGVEPVDCAIRLRASAQAGASLDEIHTGSHGGLPAGDYVTLTAEEAMGVPDRFNESRAEKIPGVFVWWLPGEEPGRGAKTTRLTPEEQKRLRSLGYIQ